MLRHSSRRSKSHLSIDVHEPDQTENLLEKVSNNATPRMSYHSYDDSVLASTPSRTMTDIELLGGTHSLLSQLGEVTSSSSDVRFQLLYYLSF